MTNIPANKKLYSTIKLQAKRKFKVWPSAYASGWLVKEYKRRGGKYKVYKSRSKSRRRVKMRYSSSSRRSKKTGLSRWFAEEWIDVCKLPRIVPCGRKNARKSSRKYPYCRPRYSVTSRSPRTARSLSKAEISKRCKHKRKSPHKKVIPKSRRRRSRR